jgi:hypothetical protein
MPATFGGSPGCVSAWRSPSRSAAAPYSCTSTFSSEAQEVHAELHELVDIARFADGDEVYETGDAYCAPPGHIPVIAAGTEIVEVNPTDAYRQTMAVVAENPAAVTP